MRILLVEDDTAIADYIGTGLRESGHVVDVSDNGKEGLFMSVTNPYDLVISDRLLPGMEGMDMVKAIRAAGMKMPILFLTALGSVDDRVNGLRAGGDDYLVKPFAFSELLARVDALCRRPPLNDTPTELRVADLRMDLLARTVTRGGQLIDLQPQEFKLLEYLLRHAGQTVTRTMLLEKVWDFHFDPQTSVVETHISRLRNKMDKGFGAELLQTIRSVGYCLREPA